MRVATRTISGLVEGATTEELDNLSIRTAAAFIAEEPNYSRLAARLLATVIDKEVQNQDIYSFSQSVALGQAQGIIGDETAAMVATHSRKLNDAILAERNWLYEFFGLRTVYDRYLLRHPETRKVIETPQYFLMRVACGLATVARGGHRVLPADLVAGLPAVVADAVQLRHHAPADVELLPAGLPRGQPRRDLRPLPRRRPALQARRRHRAVLQPDPFTRLADPGHQRAVQRHRPVAQDARLARSPRSTRAAAARARRACTWSPGTPTSRRSSSSRRTPVTAPGGPTT